MSETISALPVSEESLQSAVIDLAQLRGWKVAHFAPARTEKGWRTPVRADGKGFPDLVLVKGRRLIFAELKSQKGRVSPEQAAWLDALSGDAFLAPGEYRDVEVKVWRPADWPEIEAVLS